MHAAAKVASFLVLTGLRDPTAHYRALRMEALGIVLKEQIVESITLAIKEVYTGKAWLDGAVMAKVMSSYWRRGLNKAENSLEAIH